MYLKVGFVYELEEKKKERKWIIMKCITSISEQDSRKHTENCWKTQDSGERVSKCKGGV
jgi:hypothetical protein